MPDDFQTYLIIGISVFCVFVAFSLTMVGIFICMARKRKGQAIYSTPVTITSESYEPSRIQETFQVTVSTSNGLEATQNSQATAPQIDQESIQMPMPMGQETRPITQIGFIMPMPQPASQSAHPGYPTNNNNLPYPPAMSSLPYPVDNSAGPANFTAPYPPEPSNSDTNQTFNPPSYKQSVAADTNTIGFDMYKESTSYHPAVK